jgi:hypothetical protein
MSQESLKVLKELSMLSSNMDILVKELREQNKKNSENTEQIKKLVSEKEKKASTEDSSKPKEVQQTEGFFKNLTESFAKEISLNNKQLTESLTKQITGDLSGITKNIISPAQTKTESGDKPGGQLLNALAKSLLSGIPKLEMGGEVTKNGVALVGERGPELVQLKKDQRVISNDDFLLQEELIEMREAFEKRQNDAEKKTSDLVNGKSDLAESVTNSYGVKVPKKEIDDYRDEIRSLYSDEFEKEPGLLEDEVKSFIENYRETFDPSKFTATNQEQLKTVSDQPAANAPEELSGREKRRKEREEKKAEKEKLEGVIAPTKPKLLESLKAKGKDLIGAEKAKIEKSLVEAGLLKETKKPEPKQDITGGAKLETEQFDLSTVKASDLGQLTERLKSKMKTSGGESAMKEATQSSSKSESVQTSSAPASQTSPTVSKEIKQAETNSAMTQQDLKDIKALLGAIYKSLSGPLNIANDRPFRPNSNVL